MYGYAFCHTLRYLSSWNLARGRGWVPKACEHIFEATPLKLKGHLEVKLLEKCPMPLNLVGRTPDQSVINAFLGSKVMQRLTRGQMLRNAPWLPNLVGQTSDLGEEQCWGQKSYRVSQSQPGVKLLKNALWLPNLVGQTPDWSVQYAGVEGHAGVSQGQLGVKLLRNALLAPKVTNATLQQMIHVLLYQ